MTKDTYRALKAYEHKMATVTKTGWCHLTRTELLAFLPLYTEATGLSLSKNQQTCPRCVANALKTCYKKFQEFQKSRWGKEVDKEFENGEQKEE